MLLPMSKVNNWTNTFTAQKYLMQPKVEDATAVDVSTMRNINMLVVIRVSICLQGLLDCVSPGDFLVKDKKVPMDHPVLLIGLLLPAASLPQF